MFRLLLKLSTARKTLVLFGLAIVFELLATFVFIPPFEKAAGIGIPDTILGLDYAGYRAVFDAMTAGEGLALYRPIELLDMVFPLTYALALASLIGTCLKALDREHGAFRLLLLIPLGAALCDYSENIFLIAISCIHPGKYGLLAMAASAATWIKFAALAISICVALLVGVIAVTSRSKPKAVLTVRAPAPIGPYSQAVKTGRSLFISGQLGLDPETGALAQGVQGQADRALDNIEAILEAEGGTMNDIVKTTIFMVDLKDFAAVNEIYAHRFSLVLPARSTVQVSALPKDAAVEIEAIARLK